MSPQVRVTHRPPNATPLPYTASPLKLLGSDILLALRYAWSLPLAFLPLRIGETGPLDELYPSLRSGVLVLTQLLSIVYQASFLLCLPIAIIFMVPAIWILVYVTVALLLSHVVCMVVLNGFQRLVVSQVPVPEQPDHIREKWFYINGIAGSRFWVQQNVDQLSYTFGRKITGIHNRTAGIIFDLLECLIQRCFSYATADIREAYPLVRDALLDPNCKKVVLILHSQGGIEGGLVIDWLLDALPQNLLHNLEVYTFASAANHFNNPHTMQETKQNGHDYPNNPPPSNRSVGYIEHYANIADIVSRIGVLHYVNIPNRYLGRLFVRVGSGHLLNQHYLDAMFTLGPDRKVLESNQFMDMEVETNFEKLPKHECEETLLPISGIGDRSRNDQNHVQILRLKDFSRLWEYRNGQSPSD